MATRNVMAMRWNKLYKSTASELSLEPAVAALGVPYRTQFPGFLYGFRFFPDFVLPTLKLVIEVDDKSHDDPEKVAADEERSEKLRSLFGWRVVRCTNAEAQRDPHRAVARMLKEAGITEADLDAASAANLAAALPRPGKCPAKDRREARTAYRRSTRTKSLAPRLTPNRRLPTRFQRI